MPLFKRRMQVVTKKSTTTTHLVPERNEDKGAHTYKHDTHTHENLGIELHHKNCKNERG